MGVETEVFMCTRLRPQISRGTGECSLTLKVLREGVKKNDVADIISGCPLKKRQTWSCMRCEVTYSRMQKSNDVLGERNSATTEV